MRLRPIRYVIAAAIAIVSLQATTAHAELKAHGILDKAELVYRIGVSRWAPTMTAAAVTLFWSLATLALVWQLFQVARRGAQPDAVMWEVIQFTVVTGVWFYLLQNATDIGKAIIDSLAKLGAEASGISQDTITPSSIIDVGFSLLGKTMVWELKTGWSIPVEGGLSLVLTFAIIVLFTLVACNMLALHITQWFLLYGGIFILGFAGANSESGKAKNYLYMTVSIGAQLLVMTGIVGLGQAIVVMTYDALSSDISVSEIGVLLVVAVLEFYLVVKIPAVFAAIITGMTQGNSGLGAAAATTVFGMVGAGIGAALATVEPAFANVVGAGKAVSAAHDAAKKALSPARAETGTGAGASIRGPAAADGGGSAQALRSAASGVLAAAMGDTPTGAARGGGASQSGSQSSTGAATTGSGAMNACADRNEDSHGVGGNRQLPNEIRTSERGAATTSTTSPNETSARPSAAASGARSGIEHAESESGIDQSASAGAQVAHDAEAGGVAQRADTSPRVDEATASAARSDPSDPETHSEDAATSQASTGVDDDNDSGDDGAHAPQHESDESRTVLAATDADTGMQRSNEQTGADVEPHEANSASARSASTAPGSHYDHATASTVPPRSSAVDDTSSHASTASSPAPSNEAPTSVKQSGGPQRGSPMSAEERARRMDDWQRVISELAAQEGTPIQGNAPPANTSSSADTGVASTTSDSADTTPTPATAQTPAAQSGGHLATYAATARILGSQMARAGLAAGARRFSSFMKHADSTIGGQIAAAIRSEHGLPPSKARAPDTRHGATGTNADSGTGTAAASPTQEQGSGRAAPATPEAPPRGTPKGT